MDVKHLVVSCTFAIKDVSIRTFVLVDTRATRFPFVDKEFASLQSLSSRLLKTLRHREVIDGQLINSEAVIHVSRIGLHIDGHKEETPVFVTSLSHYLLVLSILWIRLHGIAIRFISNSLTFGFLYCLSNCSVKSATPVIAEGISISLPKHLTYNISMISAIVLNLFSCKKGLKIHAHSLYETNKAIEAKTAKDQWKTQIPAEYHDFLNLFDEKLGHELLLHHYYD